MQPKRPPCGRYVQLVLIALLALLAGPAFAQQVVSKVADFTFAPADVERDGAGNLYVLDSNGARVTRIAPNGTRTVVAGGGTRYSVSGDGHPATEAALIGPVAIAVAADGTLYISELIENRVRIVGTDGIIRNFAGQLTCDICGGFGGDGGLAVNAYFYWPADIALGPQGELYVADRGNGRIRKIQNGIVTTFAGGGSYTESGDGGLATNAGLDNPRSLAVAADGTVYVSNLWANRVRRIRPDGIIERYAGDGVDGDTGDGGPALSARVQGIFAMRTDGNGGLYLGSAWWPQGNLRHIDASGIIRRVAGGTNNAFVEGMVALDAPINNPNAIVSQPGGGYYVADGTSKALYLVTAAAPPAKPEAPQALAGNQEALVTFAAAGSGAILYTLDVDPAAGTDLDDATGALVHRVVGLTNDVAYRFRVTASNAYGDSEPSDWSDPVTPTDIAAPPTNLVAVAGPHGDVSLSFAPSVDESALGVTGYRVDSYPAGAVDNANATLSTQRTLTGLQLGTTYVFTATSINAEGLGLPSLSSNPVTPHSVPGAPAIASVWYYFGSLNVEITPPADTGDAPLLGYDVTLSPAAPYPDQHAGTLVLNRSFWGLEPGVTYTITVTAKNVHGTSAPSAPVVRTVGSPPSISYAYLSAVTGTSVTLEFSANGSPPVTNTRVELLAMNGTVLQAHDVPPGEGSVTVPVVAGQQVYFRLVATNLVGDSEPYTTYAFTPWGVRASITDAQVVEGNGGKRDMVFTVSLDHAMTVPVNVSLYSSDWEAVSPADYTAINRTITFAPGKTTAKVQVSVNGDTDVEGNEAMVVYLSDSSEALLDRAWGIGTIVNDDCTKGNSHCRY